LISLLAAELATRWLLFGDTEIAWSLRDPRHYADHDSEDDYWKLARVLGRNWHPPRRPHPILGWSGDFDRQTYRHHAARSVGQRRPVLLYGDSFSACVGDVACFEDILNADPAFAAENYLLNYGVGGYGLDQIWQLLEHSIDNYVGADSRAPFVIVGLMVTDLDRSVLSVRTGQKPRFALVAGELQQVGAPIAPDAEQWFREHPPEISSYAWRYVIRHPACPRPLSLWLQAGAARREEKRALNAAILERICAALESRGLEFTFLVFHLLPATAELDPDHAWRAEFLREWFEARGVPYLFSEEIVARSAPDPDHTEFFQPGDGHPTTLQNSLIAAEIRALLLP